MPEKKKARYAEVEKASHQILALVADSQKYFGASDASDDWRRYLSFVDEVIADGFLHQAASSLGYLLDETDQTLTQERRTCRLAFSTI